MENKALFSAVGQICDMSVSCLLAIASPWLVGWLENVHWHQEVDSTGDIADHAQRSCAG